jgi:hypothetical protein
MQVLPKWIIANPFPALHDFESLTVLDQTARIYGAMNQLIDEWNKMIEQLSAFEKSETESREEFELKLTKVIREFICSWEQKTNDIQEFTRTVINEAIQAGGLKITEVYDPETESLNMVIGGEV